MLILIMIGILSSSKAFMMLKNMHILPRVCCTSGMPALLRQMSMKVDVSEVTLRAGKSRLFQGGNPLIYSGAVEKVSGNPQAGDEVSVVDNKGNAIGRGYYNPHSQYRVRLVVNRDEQKLMNQDLEEVLTTRIRNAIRMRKALALPNGDTNTYRMVNGEGDRLSGLIVDVFGPAVVIQSSAYWCEVHRMSIERAMRAALDEDEGMVHMKILWRQAETRLKQDGWDESERKGNGILYQGLGVDADTVMALRDVKIKENGITYAVNVLDGQKTGFYCDQRENRAMLAKLCEGRTVLDTYCYTGGFALNCLAAGANKVTAVDSSGPALELARQNAELNSIDLAKLELIKGDCVKIMKTLYDEGKRFDVVIADPPKLAPTRAGVDRAKKKYVQVNMAALRLVAPGGLLLTHSCSGVITQQQLLPGLVSDAARQLGKQVTVLGVSNAAPCHSVSMAYKEGAYLTALLLHVSN